MITRSLTAATLAASLALGACAETSTMMLRKADRIERDGQSYAQLLLKHASTEANAAYKEELLRDAHLVVVETKEVADTIRKQVSWRKNL